MDVSALLTGKNFLLLAAVFALSSSIRNLFTPFFESGMGERLLPLLPIVLAIVGAMLGVCDAVTLGDRIGVGIVVGGAAGQGYKVAKTSILGYGVTPKEEKTSKPKTATEPADSSTTEEA